jgi:hypothetical protein
MIQELTEGADSLKFKKRLLALLDDTRRRRNLYYSLRVLASFTSALNWAEPCEVEAEVVGTEPPS